MTLKNIGKRRMQNTLDSLNHFSALPRTNMRASGRWLRDTARQRCRCTLHSITEHTQQQALHENQAKNTVKSQNVEL